jgi:hypothetical protein
MWIGIFQGMRKGEINILKESQTLFNTPGYSRERNRVLQINGRNGKWRSVK